MRVLVTGSEGFIGRRVMALLTAHGHVPIPFDGGDNGGRDDVLDPARLAYVVEEYGGDACIHLAAHKHAGMGEEHPAEVANLNIMGTQNVVKAVPKVILASTCKAAAPVTCYGASKLIAERIVLNAGGTVVRLVNVLGSSGSVTDLWDALPLGVPLPVTETRRMFIDPDHAAGLFVRALELDPGRYGPNLPEALTPTQLAHRLWPGRRLKRMPLRRGDRPVERLLNDDEISVPLDGELVRIFDRWERVEAPRHLVAA